ncbi:hypothetical protein GHT06_020461 [Daphnia sinensis]|uniref:Uncharacterized protein n=1 Tax=Daphnia sinensis TaxID=1820382 RepID=A0AAD5KYQ1_9CRUS|nr:hypothetical protein GHT06_020461 [Daphnia sinensis]
MSPAQKTQSLREGVAPFSVSKEILDELTVWLTKGMSGEESKAILKQFLLQSGDESFAVKPPKLDGYMQRRAKDKNVLKSVNSVGEMLIAVPHKICDIPSPLVDLDARVSTLEGGGNVEAAKDSVRSALRQWARAWLHVTYQRRRAVVDLMGPSFQFLLAGQDSFATEAESREKLFTGKILESMLKEGRPAGVAGAGLAAPSPLPRFRGARNAGDSWSHIGQRYEKTQIFVPIKVCSPVDQVDFRLSSIGSRI